MRHITALMGALFLLAAIIAPCAAWEEHNRLWLSNWEPNSTMNASKLLTGGTYGFDSGAANIGVCYDTGNTSLTLKEVVVTWSQTGGVGFNSPIGVVSGNIDCVNSVVASNYSESSGTFTTKTETFSPNVSGKRFHGFYFPYDGDHVVQSARISNVKLYWDETPPHNANFTGTPLQGSAPLYVSFTDTSDIPSANWWNWSITPATGWLAGPHDLDNEDLTVLFTDNGNYTISHGASNGISTDVETKIDYVWIFNSTATVTTPFTAVDLAFANPINGASISLYDIQNSSWTNGTTGADGKVSITTLAEHTINGYATAAGYDDAELLGVDAYSGGHTFYMYPSGYTNVSSGNVTVFISVVDDSNFGTALPGVTVTGMVGSTTQVGTTDASGIARFVFPNSTDVHFGATKAGYAGTTVTINTGIPSGGSAAVTGTIHMFRGAVTATPTITGGATTAITVDPYPCVGDGSYQDTLNCQRKQGEMGADLIAYGPDLVNFFIMLTFIGGLALMMKGFR